MEHWNHRVMRREYKVGDETKYLYGIYEVYYDDDDNAIVVSEDPTSARGNDLHGLKWSLEHMTKCLEYPVLDYETLNEI